MGRVLAVYFSQTGQLERCARAVAAPVSAAGHMVEFLRLENEAPYPFPWKFWQFLDAFPESVYLDPPPLKRWQVASSRYDLILLCYSPWFLSPSPALTAFVQSERGRALLRDTPVVTLTASRGMWTQAQEQAKTLLADAGARFCDHVALDDPHKLSSFITTPLWMLTGHQQPVRGLPRAGVPDDLIAGSARFGRALARALGDGSLDGRRAVLTGLRAAQVDTALMTSEKIGRRSFRVWGKLVRLAGRPGDAARRPVLAAYLAFLVLMIVTVVPVSLFVRTLLKPLMRARLAAQAARYEAPSGSGSERMQEFA